MIWLVAGAFVALLVMLALTQWRVNRLETEVRFARAKSHAVCIMQMRDVIGLAHEAAVLRRAAEDFDSPEEVSRLIVLRRNFRENGPSVPSMWLTDQAQRIEATMAGEDEG